MSVGHISTYALYQTTLQDSSKVQQNLADLQSQLSSGSKSQDFAGLGGSAAAQFLSLENKISKSTNYVSENSIVSTRLNSTDNVLSQVIESATNLQALISQRRTAGSSSASFGDALQGEWQNLVGQLNSSLQGRYLFGGTRTDVPPVDGKAFPTLKEDGVPDDGYYQGSKQDVTARVSDSTEISYNVRADDAGIQKIFAGLAMAKKGDDGKSDSDLQKAYDLIAQGLSGVIATRSIVNQHTVQIDSINTQEKSFQLYFKGVKEDIGNADLVSVSTQVAINQGILQASFQAFSKINALRLSDYLK